MKDKQFELHYQPIIHLPSEAPVGVEALLRWHHPTKGLLYGGQFMTVLERSPDHARFVAWQLDRALQARKAWGERDLPISINLAARCLLDRRFPDQVADALTRAGIPGHQLMFEFAESAVVTQLGLVGDAPSSCGSSASRSPSTTSAPGPAPVRPAPTCRRRTSRSTATSSGRMLVDPEAAAVVGMGLDLGRRADLQFVATGVNSAALITALRQRGCDIAQGRYLVRPLLADQLPAYLASAPDNPVVGIEAVVSLDSRRRTPTV